MYLNIHPKTTRYLRLFHVIKKFLDRNLSFQGYFPFLRMSNLFCSLASSLSVSAVVRFCFPYFCSKLFLPLQPDFILKTYRFSHLSLYSYHCTLFLTPASLTSNFPILPLPVFEITHSSSATQHLTNSLCHFCKLACIDVNKIDGFGAVLGTEMNWHSVTLNHTLFWNGLVRSKPPRISAISQTLPRNSLNTTRWPRAKPRQG